MSIDVTVVIYTSIHKHSYGWLCHLDERYLPLLSHHLQTPYALVSLAYFFHLLLYRSLHYPVLNPRPSIHALSTQENYLS